MQVNGTDPKTKGAFFFRDENFIKQFRLSIGNVLIYFAGSDFYENTSVNEILKMKGQSLENLDKIDGVSFRLTLAQQKGGGLNFEGDNLKKPEHAGVIIDPGLAVIDKVSRENGVDTLLAKYYVLDGNIFQAPDLYTLLSVRIRSAMFHMREALREVNNMFEWQMETGFRKKIAQDETETLYEFKASELSSLTTELGDEFKLQNNLLESLLAEIGIT